MKRLSNQWFESWPVSNPRLPDEGIVDLKQDLDFWQGLSDAVVGGVDDNCNGALRDPGESLAEEPVVDPVKVGADKTKGITDGACGLEIVHNSILPLFDIRVELEPSALEVLSRGDRDPEGGCGGPSLAPVVGKVDTSLRSGVIRVGLSVWAGEMAENGLGIHAVDLGTFPRSVVTEGLLEGSVVGFPGYDLGIRASEVNVEEDISWVRQEEPAHVW